MPETHTYCFKCIGCLLFTLFDVQDLAGVDLHLHLAVGLILTEPAVAGEHVLLPVHRHRDLNAVQEPTGTQPLVGVANQEPVDLGVHRVGTDYISNVLG